MKQIKENYISKDNDFYYIIDDIINNKEFQKLKTIKHHGITRYNHLLRVAYHTYKFTKKFNMRYIEATRGALLHDFFSNETEGETSYQALRNHSLYALENATHHFELSELEKDIIKTHMFPVTTTKPHYKESYVVDIIDDLSAFYEKGYSISNEIRAVVTLFFIFISIRLS